MQTRRSLPCVTHERLMLPRNVFQVNRGFNESQSHGWSYTTDNPVRAMFGANSSNIRWQITQFDRTTVTAWSLFWALLSTRLLGLREKRDKTKLEQPFTLMQCRWTMSSVNFLRMPSTGLVSGICFSAKVQMKNYPSQTQCGAKSSGSCLESEIVDGTAATLSIIQDVFHKKIA